MMYRIILFALAMIAPAAASEDLKIAAAEPNAVKRARLALANGERAALKAGAACKGAEYDTCNALLAEVQESVELAHKSLDESGINARRNPKHFKDAEMRTHKILRLVDPLRAYVHPDDLDRFDAVQRRISEINGKFLAAVMGKKKK